MRLRVEHAAVVLIVFMGMVMLAIGAITVFDTNKVANSSRELMQRNHALGLLGTMRESVFAIRSAEYGYLLSPRADQVRQYEQAKDNLRKSVEGLRDYHSNLEEVDKAIPLMGRSVAALLTRSQRSFTSKTEDRTALVASAFANQEADATLRIVLNVETTMTQKINEAQARLEAQSSASEQRILVTLFAVVMAIVLAGFAVRAIARTNNEMVDEISRMAQYDQLTGLPNRILTMDRLRQQVPVAKRGKKGFAVLAFDLDGFKKVNDTQGHAGGDDLLKQVAKRCQDALREVDTVGRLGGDEFVAMLPETDAHGASIAASKLLKAIGEPYTLQSGAVVNVGASIGISLFPEHATDSATILKNADAASYVAKARGKNQFVQYRAGMVVPEKTLTER